MIKLSALEWELADVLVDVIMKKKWKPTYKELAEELSNRLGKSINPHYGLSIPLGNVSILSLELGLPLISAWVLYSGDSSTKRISDGFYNFACEYRPEYKNMNPVDAWKSELQRIRACTTWHVYRDYLDGKSKQEVMSYVQKVQQNESDMYEEKHIEEKTHFDTYFQQSKATDPIYPDEIEILDLKLTEGENRKVTVNIKERNQTARKINIGIYGTRCAVCEVDLGIIYGKEFSGKIHVHHLHPIGEISEEREINPLEDLRPVCPNCHMIIHCRSNPPYSIDEVKKMIANNKKHN